MIGRTLLEKYEIIRVIGNGGMGTVYEAKELSTGRRVAIKWMHARPFAPDDPDLLRFTQEARIATKLNSPHIVGVLELARDPEADVPFLVMELLEGEDVRKLVERVGPLLPDTALRIAAQACAGLAKAHAAGVVHRDIKPDNIYLAEEGDTLVVKILDFGIAKIRGAAESASGGADLTVPAIPMTQSGQVIGTPLFMAPEQIGGAKHVDARCDVFSMGVTLYAMLVGTPPHANIKSFVQLLHTLINAPTLPVCDAAPWVSPVIAEVVDKARAKEKDGRYPNAEAMLNALMPLLPEGTALTKAMLVGVPDAEKQRIGSASTGATTAKRTGAFTEHDATIQFRPEPQASPKRLVWIAVAVLIALVVAGLAIALGR